MHLLYLDDSGSSGNKNEQYFVLGGVSVPEASARWLSHKIEQIALEIDKDNPGGIEFHAAEIFRGAEHPWKNFKDRTQRSAIINNILRILEKAYPDVTLFACAIHRASFPTEDPVIKAYEEISSRFDLYLQRISAEGSPQRGLVIIDKSSYETGLQKLAAQIRQSGNRWGSYTTSICEVPMFIDSRASRNIQLADHVAYAVFRRYNANDLTYFNTIESRFDQKDDVICGLIHKQTYNRHCTCPACLTRRG
ncbi:MAG: DUF3800 domain-containing protein [Chloroflexota bacterium]